MTATILDGRALGARLRPQLEEDAARFAADHGRRARLTLALAGADATAALYAAQVERAGARVGVEVAARAFPEDVSELTLRTEIAALGARADIDGVALLLPLPSHIRQRVVMEVLPASKDVDGLGPQNAGRLMLGFPSFVPSTADAAMELLHDAGLQLQGRDTVVIGRSNVGGKPAALLFLREGATVTFCHSRTPDLGTITRQADVVFCSSGYPDMLTGAMLKPGAIVLDAGMTQADGVVRGDVAFASARTVAGYLTPAPGGLGPLTPLMLLRHTLAGPS